MQATTKPQDTLVEEAEHWVGNMRNTSLILDVFRRALYHAKQIGRNQVANA